MLFGDAATFHKNRSVNRHNFHYFASSNPDFINTHNPAMYVWRGFVGDYVITLTFLRSCEWCCISGFLLPRNVPLNIQQRKWVLHDVALVHHTALIDFSCGCI